MACSVERLGLADGRVGLDEARTASPAALRVQGHLDSPFVLEVLFEPGVFWLVARA